MYRFWTAVVEPLLNCLQPKTIVEIGSDRAENTRHLVDFCQRHQAVLHAIDPSPSFEAAAWQRTHAGVFVFHQQLSLQALPLIGPVDAVLIDGDHNWYTVFHELETLETLAAQHGHAFPLVFLHDIGWPYGRRDLYYNPSTIPAGYRLAYRPAGMQRDSPVLYENDGLNSSMNNALCEGGPHNGVLTAIDEYLAATRLELKFSQVPGFHGLGLLAARERLAHNPALAAALTKIDAALVQAGPIRALEEKRLALEIKVSALEAKARANGNAGGVARLQARAARLNKKLVSRQLSRAIGEVYA